MLIACVNRHSYKCSSVPNLRLRPIRKFPSYIDICPLFLGDDDSVKYLNLSCMLKAHSHVSTLLQCGYANQVPYHHVLRHQRLRCVETVMHARNMQNYV